MKKDSYLEVLLAALPVAHREGREALASEMFAWMVGRSDDMMQLGALLTIQRVLAPRAVEAAMRGAGVGK